jgi:glycosyltransferase involved in cell wall biosynthesis
MLNLAVPSIGSIMTEIVSRSEKVVVMSKKAVEFLVDIYGVNIDKIELILHGTPDFPSIDSSHFKKRFKLEGRKMLLTFGLLSPNKGIETVLNALPEVVEQFPDITYVVLGKTHPNILKEQGEKYRMGLMKLSEKLGLKTNVIFDNRFVFPQPALFMPPSEVPQKMLTSAYPLVSVPRNCDMPDPRFVAPPSLSTAGGPNVLKVSTLVAQVLPSAFVARNVK